MSKIEPEDSFMSMRKPRPSAVVIPVAAISALAGCAGLIERGCRLLEERGRHQEALERRLDRLERWQCVLGWDPGGVSGETTRQPGRQCLEED